MYILTELIMNGTITMEIFSIGIEAETFKDAIVKLKSLPSFPKATILTENDFVFRYTIAGEFPCHGEMRNDIIKTL